MPIRAVMNVLLKLYIPAQIEMTPVDLAHLHHTRRLSRIDSAKRLVC